MHGVAQPRHCVGDFVASIEACQFLDSTLHSVAADRHADRSQRVGGICPSIGILIGDRGPHLHHCVKLQAFGKVDLKPVQKARSNSHFKTIA